jgi:menaquinone-dependent protoporphyrinogen oxidase
MQRVLIAYGTTDGQTRSIAECLADVLRRHELEVHLVDLRRATPDPRAYDGVIIGASVRRGRHQTHVGEYVRETREALKVIPSAFYSVSLALCTGGDAGRKEAEGYAEEFVRLTGWRPDRIVLFAGALAYTRYNPFLRWIMKRMARSKGSADLDTSRDYVYTDWDEVRRFAEGCAEAFGAVPAVW